jgi:hypothetical protein
LFDSPPPHLTVDEPPPNTSPPGPSSGGEIPCNGVDDDGDGHPSPTASCDPQPSSEIVTIEQDDPFVDVVPDLDGDGLDDILTTSGDPRVAYLISGTAHGGPDATLAFEWVELPTSGGGGWDSRVAELDGMPGADLWVGDRLYLDPTTTGGWVPSAIWLEDEPIAATDDFDGDGIDEILAVRPQLGANGVYLGHAPFTGGLDVTGWTPVAQSAASAWVAGDIDGAGLPDLGLVGLDGLDYLVSPDGVEIATLDAPAAPRSAGDFDGDGVGDLLVTWQDDVDPGRPCELWLLAGPFLGAVDVEASTRLSASVACAPVASIPDFDGDGLTDFSGRGDGLVFALSSTEVAAFAAVPSDSASWRSPDPLADGRLTWGELDGNPGLDGIANHGTSGAVYLDIGF